LISFVRFSCLPIQLPLEHGRAFENDDSPRIKQDVVTRGGVPSFPLILILDAEFAESADEDIFATLQRFLYDFEGGLDCLAGLGVREIRVVGNRMYNGLFGESHNEGLPRARGPVLEWHQEPLAFLSFPFLWNFLARLLLDRLL